MSDNKKSAKDVQHLAKSIAQDFEDILTKHGLNDYRITNFNLMPTEHLTITGAESTANGHWEWKCWQTPNGVKCGWVWVSN